jgi:hypothetical protein
MQDSHPRLPRCEETPSAVRSGARKAGCPTEGKLPHVNSDAPQRRPPVIQSCGLCSARRSRSRCRMVQSDGTKTTCHERRGESRQFYINNMRRFVNFVNAITQFEVGEFGLSHCRRSSKKTSRIIFSSRAIEPRISGKSDRKPNVDNPLRHTDRARFFLRKRASRPGNARPEQSAQPARSAIELGSSHCQKQLERGDRDFPMAASRSAPPWSLRWTTLVPARWGVDRPAARGRDSVFRDARS